MWYVCMKIRSWMKYADDIVNWWKLSGIAVKSAWKLKKVNSHLIDRQCGCRVYYCTPLHEIISDAISMSNVPIIYLLVFFFQGSDMNNHRCSHPLKREMTLYWRHNDHSGVSNHQPHCCLLNRLFRHRSKKTSNFKAPRHWPLCGEFTGTGEFPAQRANNAENGPIWWRHHGSFNNTMVV